MKIKSVNFFGRGFQIACCLLLILGFYAISPIVYADNVKDFVEQWQIDKKWGGDFDGMAQRRIIRVLVVYNKLGFFFDKGRTRGATYDLFMEFETYINKKQKTGIRKIKLVFLPVPRDYLIPWLIEGRGDIAAANLTITDERKKNVDFSDPLLTNVKEILVTGSTAPSIKNLNSLSGKEIHLRRSSSYYEHLKLLNTSFKKQGKSPVKLVVASEYMEDSDLLEMVNAGLIPMIIVDDHKVGLDSCGRNLESKGCKFIIITIQLERHMIPLLIIPPGKSFFNFIRLSVISPDCDVYGFIIVKDLKSCLL